MFFRVTNLVFQDYCTEYLQVLSSSANSSLKVHHILQTVIIHYLLAGLNQPFLSVINNLMSNSMNKKYFRVLFHNEITRLITNTFHKL